MKMSVSPAQEPGGLGLSLTAPTSTEVSTILTNISHISIDLSSGDCILRRRKTLKRGAQDALTLDSLPRFLQLDKKSKPELV